MIGLLIIMRNAIINLLYYIQPPGSEGWKKKYKRDDKNTIGTCSNWVESSESFKSNMDIRTLKNRVDMCRCSRILDVMKCSSWYWITNYHTCSSMSPNRRNILVRYTGLYTTRGSMSNPFGMRMKQPVDAIACGTLQICFYCFFHYAM